MSNIESVKTFRKSGDLCIRYIDSNRQHCSVFRSFETILKDIFEERKENQEINRLRSIIKGLGCENEIHHGASCAEGYELYRWCQPCKAKKAMENKEGV